jgi:hypothetical protein
VARGTWARLCFETTGGEEELSFLCRVKKKRSSYINSSYRSLKEAGTPS